MDRWAWCKSRHTGEHRDKKERKRPGREDQIVAECHFRSGQPKSTPWRNRTTEHAYCSSSNPSKCTKSKWEKKKKKKKKKLVDFRELFWRVLEDLFPTPQLIANFTPCLNWVESPAYWLPNKVHYGICAWALWDMCLRFFFTWNVVPASSAWMDWRVSTILHFCSDITTTPRWSEFENAGQIIQLFSCGVQIIAAQLLYTQNIVIYAWCWNWRVLVTYLGQFTLLLEWDTDLLPGP